MELRMKPIVVWLIAGLVLALAAGQAHAEVPCASGPGIIVAGDQLSASLSFTPAEASPGVPTSCSQSLLLPIPAGYYGVYRVVTTASVDQLDGDQSTFTVVVNSDSQAHGLVDTFSGSYSFTKYYAVGDGGLATFESTFGMSMTGDPSSFGDIESADILVAYTSAASQQTSINQVATEQLGLATHMGTLSSILLSSGSVEGDDEVIFLGGVGSYDMGVAGRYNLAPGFSLVGGVSAVNLSLSRAGGNGLLAAGALRFVQPESGEFRIVAEAGAEVAPLSLSFARHYDDGTTAGSDFTAVGDGILASIYGRAGVIWTPHVDDSVLFAASLKQGRLAWNKLAEPNLDDVVGAYPNLFAADFSSGMQDFTTVRASADWTHHLDGTTDVMASVGVGVAYGTGTTANVFGVGTVTSENPSTAFVDYGLRASWKLAPRSAIDGFLAGSTGTNIGTHAQIGAAYHMSF
jgi:hypothetical protein